MQTIRGRWIGAALAVVLALPTSMAIAAELPQADTPERPVRALLEAHVRTLASPEYGGRRGAGARKAEAYIVEHLRALGLEPLFDGQFTQDIPGPEPGQVVGRNVGAVLRGSDPELRNEPVLLSAHYDHLGVRDGVLYPGADDNASGVAMLLEVARSLADGAERPRRSVLLVAFDLEENGLWGSRHFVADPPVPLDRIALFLTADLIAGSLGGVCDDTVFVIGSERAPVVRPWIEEAAAGQPVEVAQVGSDLLVIDRSDYGPFRLRKVPYLFFSTGESPHYHTPQDTPESLDYPKLEAISRVILGVVIRAANAPEAPTWHDTPEPTLAEAVAMRRVLSTLLEHRERLQVPAFQVSLMASAVQQIDAIVERGAMTPAERTRIVRVAQIVLFSVL